MQHLFPSGANRASKEDVRPKEPDWDGSEDHLRHYSCPHVCSGFLCSVLGM